MTLQFVPGGPENDVSGYLKPGDLKVLSQLTA